LDGESGQQHRKAKTNIHGVSGILTYDHIYQATKAYATDSSATAIGEMSFFLNK
jgi:hypothetical protein